MRKSDLRFVSGTNVIVNEPFLGIPSLTPEPFRGSSLKQEINGMSTEEVHLRFGKRIQRCYGCFVAFYLKDMWLGEDATFYCENCKDDTMFHFDQFSRVLDISKLPSAQSDEDHH